MKYSRADKTVHIATILLIILTSAYGQESGEKIFRKHDAPVKAVAFSTDGKILASGGEDKKIYLWDIQTGELTGTIQTSYAVKCIRFMKDVTLLAACGKDIILIDNNGKLIRTFSGYTTDIWSFSYNQATGRIVAGSYAKSVKVWDFNSAKQVVVLEGHERSSLPACFNPSGNVIATGSLDKSVRLWDAATGNEKFKLELHSENVFAIVFHPSGKYVASASADKTIRLWNAETGKIVRTFTGHKGAIFDVQFSTNGHHMLSCDADKTIILWETATGKKVTSFTGHTAAVNCVRFSDSGTDFASASDDQTVRFWPLDKKVFLSGSYYEKEIEDRVAGHDLFLPRKPEETKQDYTLRVTKANQYLDDVYNEYYKKYTETLDSIPIE